MAPSILCWCPAGYQTSRSSGKNPSSPGSCERSHPLLASFFSTSVAPGCRTGLSRLRHWSSAWTTYAPFITHDVGDAVFISDRVIAMTRRSGRVKRDERNQGTQTARLRLPGFAGTHRTRARLVLAVQSEVDPDGEGQGCVAGAVSRTQKRKVHGGSG